MSLKTGSMKRIFTLVLLLAATAAGARQSTDTRREYIEKYKQIAVEEMLQYGIPASITLAQGCLESRNGTSELALKSNNHFGIKCKSTWTGMTVTHDDDERDECFRKYDDPEDSYRDHSVFLDSSPRYAALFKLDVTDYKGWAQGLKDAGYATDPAYPDKLTKIIEEYQLYLLDEGGDLAVVTEVIAPVVVEEQGVVDVDGFGVDVYGKHKVYHNNGTQYVYAAPTDSYESVAAEFGISVEKLNKFNDLVPGDVIAPGDMIYVKAKKNKGAAGDLLHEVEPGETMRSVAQKHAVKVKKLYKMNRLPLNYPLKVGQQLRLR